MAVNKEEISKHILALEKSFNERWSIGDSRGYLDNYAEDISYFDPILEKLIVGSDAVISHINSLYSNPNIVRNEYLNPSVHVSDGGDFAVLAYNLNTYVRDDNGTEQLSRAWNATEVYRLTDGTWRIVHSNWALTKSTNGQIVF
ncbi:YybH family protein [Mycobacteroides salmoniphilum]|uniref:Calcium/calmodulin dependent protein kinase II Association n=1 Tax=Mycobacteroides salmoniphilum TaxID=404941 RepID=A0A4R8SLJ3_9MYCO|nr:DUF4440 domain-containing protein [Mycobacteroides salmoniphilum]TDZ98519.1 Calcium/calmodulin dependent protein kinase II Association [Mycobacteroides salmoniphilum]TEA03049.1 Calcium/calmodulin dependent protein kinase II Association [Mycobacteroides salmoniphilum]